MDEIQRAPVIYPPKNYAEIRSVRYFQERIAQSSVGPDHLNAFTGADRFGIESKHSTSKRGNFYRISSAQLDGGTFTTTLRHYVSIVNRNLKRSNTRTVLVRHSGPSHPLTTCPIVFEFSVLRPSLLVYIYIHIIY